MPNRIGPVAETERARHRAAMGAADLAIDWTPRERSTLTAIAGTFVPGADDRAPRRADRRGPRVGRRPGPGPRPAARAAGHGAARRQPAPRRWGARPVRRWTPPQREAYLRRWAGSPIAQRRSAFHALRKLSTFLAYADPAGPDGAGTPIPRHAAIGYQPGAAAGHGRPDPDRAPRPALRRGRSGHADDPRRGRRHRRLGRRWRGRRRGPGGRRSLGRRPRGRAVRRRGIDADRRAGRLRPAVPRARAARDLGWRRDPAGRLGGRRRDARQLDDHDRGAGRRPRGVAHRARARRASRTARPGRPRPRPWRPSWAVAATAYQPPKDEAILRGAAALGWEAGADPPQRHRLRRLRELPVRLPAGVEAVRHPRPPRHGGRPRRPDRAARPGHARAARRRPRGRRRGPRPRPRPADRRADPRSRPARAASVSGRSGSTPRRSSSRPGPCARRPSCRGRASTTRSIGRHLRIHPVTGALTRHADARRALARADAGCPQPRVRRARRRVARLRHRVGARAPRPAGAGPALGGGRRPRRADGRRPPSRRVHRASPATAGRGGRP